MTRRHLAEMLPRRWAHVRGVAGVAARLGEELLGPGDKDLLVAAALLHDIGYAPVLVDSGYHPLDGARFVIRQGQRPRLASLIAHHSASAFVAEIKGLAAELAEFPDERTAVRDALWYSDMRISPVGAPVSFDERIAEIRQRHGEASDVVRALDAGAFDARRDAIRRTEARIAAAARERYSLAW